MPCPMLLPPGPSPSQDELWRLEQQPSMLEEFRSVYGDIFTLHRPGRPPRVFISDPRHFRAILHDHDQELACLGTTIYNDLIGPQSMMKLHGAEHRRIRQIVAPPLVGASLRRHEEMVHQLIAEGLQGVRGCPPQPLSRLMVKITARITLELVFADLLPEAGDAMEQALVGTLNALHDGRTANPELRAQLEAEYRNNRIKLDELVFTEIVRARGAANGEAGDSVLSALLAAPEQLTDHNVRDQILTVLTGGTTTSANGICMALYWLHHRPDVAARLTTEARTLPAAASARAIASLPYLSAVCREALRVPTVTPTSAARRVVVPFTTADGFHFPAGTEVIIAIHLAHHHEPTYPDHDEFQPERFLDEAPGPRYLPFGIGAHRCLGAQLTELEMKIALVECLRHPDFAVLGADAQLQPRSHGVNLTTPHSLQAYCPAHPG